MFHYAPYGPAPWYYFPLMECCSYFLFIVCLRYAIRKGPRYINYLLGGLAFGVILEYLNVVATHGYTYGKFLVMFGNGPSAIPLCIGVGWSIIMFSTRVFTDEMGLPLWSAAAMDALLVLSIDLSMDTVAYRLHMWNWNWPAGANPLRADWFGVPYNNFFAWLLVAFFYSSFSRLMERFVDTQQRNTPVMAALVPVTAIVLSEAALFVIIVCIDKYLDRYRIGALYRCIAFSAVLLVMIGRGWKKKNAAASPLPAVTWLVPLWFHAASLAWFFTEGFFMESKRLTAVAILNVLLALYIHTRKRQSYGRSHLPLR